MYVRAPTGFFLSGARDGFEFQFVLGAIALALLFTGAGRYALDARTPWNRNPARCGAAALALAVVTSAGVVILFR